MAITPQIHLRSISLPSRLHPINGLENELQKLKSYQASSHSISSPEAIESKILGLIQLYDSFQELVNKSPSTQQSLVRQDEKSIEESLDRSVQLLDTCSQTRDLLMSIKENVQALQSSMRRKGQDCVDDVAAYFSFRKKMNKYIAKTIKNLVKTSTRCSSSRSNNLLSLTNGDGDGDFITLLKEVSEIANDVLKTVLVFMSCPKAKSSGWPLVSKMILAKSLARKRGDGHHHVDVNEFENTDFAILSLQEKIRLSVAEINDVQTVQKSLESFESYIERFECGLESLFRQLVQCRVVLLNVLTDH